MHFVAKVSCALYRWRFADATGNNPSVCSRCCADVWQFSCFRRCRCRRAHAIHNTLGNARSDAADRTCLQRVLQVATSEQRCSRTTDKSTDASSSCATGRGSQHACSGRTGNHEQRSADHNLADRGVGELLDRLAELLEHFFQEELRHPSHWVDRATAAVAAQNLGFHRADVSEHGVAVASSLCHLTRHWV